jgi:N-acetylneuraminate synthase/N,N'-diacetyllegionaminate synthase
VIAEAGTNHNGSFDTALALVDCAADAGADAVKFQTFRADALVAPTDHPIARLNDSFGRFGATVHEMFRKAEMPLEWLPKLFAHAQSRGIMFLSTPFDEQSADVLNDLGVPAFKIASYEVVHLPLLRYVARFGKPMLISTGMADLGEIEDALDAIRGEGNNEIALFHCPIGYPVAFENVHLAAMDTLRQAFGVPVGLSDHTLGITAPLAAVARGADLIEKHFTLDAHQHGPDHDFAAEPATLKAMIRGIRDVTAAVGDPRKICQPSEELHYRRGRRSLFAACNIPEGTTITAEMLAVLRPGVGLKPKYLDVVVGRSARKFISAFSPITWDDV